MRTDLEHANDLPYQILSGNVRPWSYKEFEGAPVTVADRLSSALWANPHLKVHVACGYHDGATPYFAAEYVLANLAIPGELKENFDIRYNPTGHEPSRLVHITPGPGDAHRPL